MAKQKTEKQVPEFVAWEDISQTYAHEECTGDMEWHDDFTVKGVQYVVHRCTECGVKETRHYPLEMIVMRGGL